MWGVQVTFRWGAFSNYQVIKKPTFFRSGTSRMIQTVTSSWHHHMLHPHGLVSMLLGLRCQFLGDWSQQMAIFTSESDSNTFAERKCSVICLTFFSVSLRTWIGTLRIHEWLQCHKTPVLLKGCVSILFYFRLSVNPLSSLVNGYFEARWPVANVGVRPSSVYKYKAKINFNRTSVFCGFAKNHILFHV